MTEKHKAKKMRRGMLCLALFKGRKEKLPPEDHNEGCTCIRVQVQHNVPAYVAKRLNLYHMETPPPETHPGREISPKEQAAETESASVPKPRKGSCRGAEYERMFLCVQNCLPDTSCRIKRSTREKLSMIVRIIGQDGMTVKSYVNNILDAHLEQYRDEINKLINNAKNIKL